MHAVNSWTTRLAAIDMRLLPEAKTIAHTVKTAAASHLITAMALRCTPGRAATHDPGIRDGIIMGAALLRLGTSDVMRDFIRWYAAYQAEDGALPDCTDREEGTEWLPEFDAYGQRSPIFGVMEYYRFTGDRAFLEEMHPTVRKTVAFLEGLRSRRLTAEYRTPEKKGYYGLLPESDEPRGIYGPPGSCLLG